MFMLRKLVVALSIMAVAVCAFVVTRSDTVAQQKKNQVSQPEPIPMPLPLSNRPLKPASHLPVTHVVLFNSGVGYFQRSGPVEGDARVDLQFSASNINDLIKSLVIEDLKGRIMPLRYDSQEPIEKTLKSFGIDLSYNPSFAQILNQARGEKVEITLQNNGTSLPGTLSGTIIGMESAQRPVSATATTTTEMEFLNLSCAEGLRTVALSQVQRVRFLNPVLEAELKRALEVVAGGHDALKKSVRLDFKGEGKRDVKVGYVIENPIWKTSYRMVLGKNGKPKLLGWANVENTSDEDWTDVKLSLVSARPISFQMDLYPPLFIPRPTVEPELFASLRPPTYQGPLTNSMNFNQFGMQGGIGMANNFVPVNPGPQQQLGQGNVNLGFGGGFGGVPQFNAGQFGNLAGQLGMQGGNRFQNPMLQNINNNDNNNNKLNYQDLQNRRQNQKIEQAQVQQKAAELGSIISNVDPNLIEAALTAEELGNPARYSIEERVSLPRQQSAMIPILEQDIEASRVSIYNERVQAKHPLLGMKMKNNTKQSLMSGPITIYDDDQYVGDARILDLQPGEERFLSYAIDTGVEIKPFDRTQPAPEMTVSLQNGQLNVQYKLRQTRSYIIKNRSPEPRKVVIEQPVRDGWVLAEAKKLTQEKEAWKAGAVEKPMERTRDLYRFSVDVQPGETVKYEVAEELPRIDPFAITKQTDWSGFATSLGLDVWTDVKRTPEDNFTLELQKDALQVTHKDRRATTYFLRNRVSEDRVIWLEHILPEGRALNTEKKPEPENNRRFRFKIELPAHKTVTYVLSEEWTDAKPELFPLKVVPGSPVPRPNSEDAPQTRFVTELGFEVWTSKRQLTESLEKVTIVNGRITATSKETESVSYFVRNLTDVERKFTLDHIVRQDWSFVGNQKAVDGAGQRFQFTMTCGKEQTSKQSVSEERRTARIEEFSNVIDDRKRFLLGSTIPSPAVKETLKKGWGLITTLETTQTNLKDLRARLSEINTEQSRLKTNMEKLPTESALYKRFVDKLDKEETALEEVQKQLKDKTEAEKKQKAELATFLDRLSVQ
jgi:hypothetical protein